MCIKEPFWSPAGASGFLLDWDGVIAETKLDFSGIREKYYGGRRAMLLEEAFTLEPDAREAMFKELAELEMAGAEGAVPVPGAFELIEWLNKNNVPYCILSRNLTEVIRRGAEVIGFDLPPRTWGRDNMEWVKPDPRALLAAAGAIGADPRRCVYVGDFLYDLQGARRAGMRAVLVQRDEPRWSCWADVVYPLLTGLVEALHSPEPVVPWEYREIYAKKGERWLHNAASFIFSVPGEPSPTTDCWLARAASLGVGGFYVDPEKIFTPDDWKKNPSFDTSAMGLKWSEVVSGFLAPRYPLARVVTECEAPLNAPKNSLDIMRFIERKKI